MPVRYRHTQKGYIIMGGFGGTALLVAGMIARKAAAAAMIPGLIALGVVGWVFSSLTIEVTDDELTASFGPGWRIKRVPLDDIEAVSVVRNPWYWGWGIRMTPRGTLYNVSGVDAVEVRMRRGTTFRLGTDEPAALHAAIRDAIDARAGATRK
jgi:hypothetical protein